tara:strand:+ start:6504 stop:6689 length:186 start_codon:yes stop_codon:yes gene_type:complete
MARDPYINTATGQRRVIRKKGDLTTGKGDWLRIGLTDKQYSENYDKIDWGYKKFKKQKRSK